jgi:hypothetical protein
MNNKTRMPKNELTRRPFALANEKPEAWNRRLAERIDRYQRGSKIERALVEDIAFCRRRPICVRVIDTTVSEIGMEEQSPDVADTCRNAEAARLAHDSFRSAWPYELDMRRSYSRTPRDLEKLRDSK